MVEQLYTNARTSTQEYPWKSVQESKQLHTTDQKVPLR